MCFQRQRAATGKGVVEGRQLVGVEQLGGLRVGFVQLAGLAPGAADFGAGALQHFFVIGVLPLHQVFDDLEQALALDGGFFLVDAIFEAAALLVAGVVDHLRKDHRPRRRQRAARPPQVQGAGVAVADGFFARGGGVDGVQRQGDFDEFFGGFDGGHGVSCSSGIGGKEASSCSISSTLGSCDCTESGMSLVM